MLAGAVAAIFLGPWASAQVLSVTDAQVQSYFVSQSDAYQDSDPLGLTPFPLSGTGPYGIVGPAGLPAPPTPQNPVGIAGNSFASGPSTSIFFDTSTPPVKAQSWIDTGPLGGANVVDANILLDLRLNNPTTSYAYLGVVFGADFYVNGPLGGGITGAPSMVLSGFSTGANAYAEAGAMIDYWFASANSAGVVGPWSYLGSLTYYWQVAGTNPSFALAVAPTGSLLPAATAGGGMLALQGRAWVAGDPASIRMEIGVPEIDPSATGSVLALLTGGIGLLERRRRATTVRERLAG